MIDLLVAGGGPVGLAAAIAARLAGLDVTVLEPRSGTIDKACGEGLMPGALPLLARLGAYPVGHVIAGIGYRDATASIDHRFAGGHGLGVRRTVLHSTLAARADALGVVRVQGKLRSLEQNNESVSAAGIRARWLLGCDGLHSSVARLTGLALAAPLHGRRYGIRQHFMTAPWSDLVEVHYGSSTELYVTPVAADMVGIAMLGPQGASFDTAVAAVPAVADRLHGAETLSDRRGAGPFRQRTRGRVSGRVLLAGDASGYVDALTGEGLRLGFEQVHAAVASIVDGRPERYEREWRAITREPRMVTSGLVAWAGSPLRSGLVPAAARVPKFFGAVVERLAR
ncbi:MAG: FAD-binding protein [Homoserinimonas sp.]|jgi:flavin-dependent dehydrogenase|nr:FAD-binding protein [Homoserinimonas sp.]